MIPVACRIFRPGSAWGPGCAEYGFCSSVCCGRLCGCVRKLPAFRCNGPILLRSNHQDANPGIRGGYVPVERSLFIQILSELLDQGIPICCKSRLRTSREFSPTPAVNTSTSTPPNMAAMRADRLLQPVHEDFKCQLRPLVSLVHSILYFPHIA